MKLLNFDSFVNESLNEKIKNSVFLNDIADSDYTTVEVSLRHVHVAQDIFNDTYKKLGKMTSSNTFLFKQIEDVHDFVDMLINGCDIPNSEIELS